jgi:hypothetical protein
LALIGRSSTPDEPWGENPFPEGTPAHRSWTETNLWTKEHLALFQAEMLESRPSEEASPKEFLDYGLKVLAGQFDIWARAFSRSIVPTDQAAGLYEQLLNELEQAMAANATRFTVSFLPEGLYTTEVRRLLLQRKQYWLGRMLRKVRKRKEANCAKAAANRGDGVESSEAEPRKPPDRAEPGIPPSPRRGPKPDYETALRVAEIVARVAGKEKWRTKLEDICFELDESTIPRPKTWKARGHRDWFEALSERHLVEKAIAHHLELSTQYRNTFS